jgi:uracil DNA glycosylase
VRTPVGLGQQWCKGSATKSNSGIWHNFQGFSFFEVKLKLIIQCPYHRKGKGNGISRVLIFNPRIP